MCVEHLGSAPKKGGCVTVLLLCPGWPTDASVCWAHGLLFVDGAMCSHVYCLSPPILLPNHCFSWSTCVPLLPSFVSLFSLLVFVVLCWSVVFRRLCVMLTAQQFSACLFIPSGVVFVYLCFILLLKNPIPLHFESSPSLSSCILTDIWVFVGI